MLATVPATETNIFNAVNIIDWTKGCHLDDDGNVIPGIYRGMPDYVYHSTGGYSSSLFKEMATKSAFHVKRKYIDKKMKPITTATQKIFNFGTLVHELSLEADRFYRHYFKLPINQGFDEFTTDELKAKAKEMELKVSGTRSDLKTRINDALPEGAKKIWEYDDEVEKLINQHCAGKRLDAIKGELTSRTTLYNAIWNDPDNHEIELLPIDHETWVHCHELYDALMGNPYISIGLADGEAELSCFAVDPETGLLLKCRFDFLNRFGQAWDVKTARTADDRGFTYHANDMGYDIQDAFYTKVGILCGLDINAFIFAVVEKDIPIADAKEYSPNTKMRAKEKLKHYLNKFKTCLDTNEWPAYKAVPSITQMENNRGIQ